VTGEGRGSAGSVEHADLDNGIAKDEPIVLPPQTPQPAPRQTTIPPPGQSSAASQPVPEVRGAIVPQQQPGSAQAATGARSTASASVSGVVLPRNEPTGGTTDPSGDDRNNPTNPAGSTTRPPGTRTGGDATVVTDGSGELPAGAPTSGDANTRGTAPNDSTRSYFFSQGMLQGVNETGQELGGRLGQIMVATGYLLTGQPQRAKEWLDIDAGESVVWNSFVDDIDIWVEVFTGDPTDADSPRSFESGRNAGKTLTSLVAAKFGQSFRNVRDVSRSPPVDGLPQMPARNPGTPALVPPKSDATQDAVKPRATR
jgi:hypothetical protein